MKIYANKKYLIIISLSIFLFIIGVYFISQTCYNPKIKHVIKQVNKINKKVCSYGNSNKININSLKKDLPKHISSLSSIYNKVTSMNPPKKSLESHNYLLKGIENNIHMYENLLTILENPENTKLESSYTSLEKYKDNCFKYYSDCSPSLLSSKNNLAYIDKCISYTAELVQCNKQNKIFEGQYKDYITNIDLILTSFLEIKSDFSYYKKNKTMDYKSAIKDLDSKSEDLDNILADFSKITVPSKGIECYKLLYDTLDNYKSYIQNFRYALTKQASDNCDKNIDSLYLECDLSYKNMDSCYNKFINSYSSFKKLAKL